MPYSHVSWPRYFNSLASPRSDALDLKTVLYTISELWDMKENKIIQFIDTYFNGCDIRNWCRHQTCSILDQIRRAPPVGKPPWALFCLIELLIVKLGWGRHNREFIFYFFFFLVKNKIISHLLKMMFFFKLNWKKLND